MSQVFAKTSPFVSFKIYVPRFFPPTLFRWISLSLSLSRPHLNLTKIQILKSGDEIKEIREREARNNLKEKKERGERREV
jgi:hypothetical protein